ncbi:hypothetical protein HDV02_005838, partial [Globomyces sp. JEL0801]
MSTSWSYKIPQRSRPKSNMKQLGMANQATIETLIKQAKPVTPQRIRNQHSLSRPMTTSDRTEQKQKRESRESEERTSKVRFTDPETDPPKEKSALK